VFAAPVFTRGFLRTYSQYLGLDSAELVALLPDPGEAPVIEPEPDTARTEFERRTRPLRDQAPYRPSVPRPGGAPSPLTRGRPGSGAATPITYVIGLVAGVAIVVAIIGFLAHRAGGGSPVSAPVAATAGAGQAAPTGGVQPRATAPPPARKAGSMPNLVGKDERAAVQQLQQAGVAPLVISVASTNKSDKPGVVLSQKPSAGTAISTNSDVSLIVNQPAPAATPFR
jgi:hypothetical protein